MNKDLQIEKIPPQNYNGPTKKQQNNKKDLEWD